MRDEVYIIGGGPSLKNFDPIKLEGKDVIAVNNGILLVERANYFITMDQAFPNKSDRRIFKSFPGTKFFVANLTPQYMKEENGKIIDTRFNLVYDLKGFDVIIKSRHYEGFGKSFKDFRTGKNSGYAAIQLAILLNYKNIHLLGFDLMRSGFQTHFHGYYGSTPDTYQTILEEYYTYFKSGIVQLLEENSDINIFSCSPISKLNAFLRRKDI